MIKINLATRKQSVLHATSAKQGPSIDFSAFPSLLKDPVIRRFMLAVIVAIGGYYAIEDQKETLLQAAMTQTQDLQAETARLKQEAERLQEYEQLKKVLEEDEKIIRNKLQILLKLVAERNAPPKILIALSESMHDNAWLTEFKITNSAVSISGGATDFNEVSDIIKRIGESTYFEEVMLTDSERKAVGKAHAAFFNLSAKRRK